MLRTIVSFDPAEKAWLDREAKIAHVSMTEVVRQAVACYRNIVENHRKPNMQQLLKKTAGTWKHGDGLAYQKKLREEWN